MKKILIFLLLFLLTTNAYAVLAKSTESVDAWTDVTQNALVEGATVDVSGNYQTTLAIDAALGTATATTNGLKVIVQVSNATSGDNNWSELTSLAMLAGITANLENLTNNPAGAGTTVLTVADTTGYVTEGSLGFISDSTVINSEIYMIKTFATNASITLVDGTTNSHVQNTPMSNSAATIVVNIPDSANRLRVIYDNTQDASGAPVRVRANITKITAI